MQKQMSYEGQNRDNRFFLCSFRFHTHALVLINDSDACELEWEVAPHDRCQSDSGKMCS